MACTYIFTDPITKVTTTFETEALLNEYLTANRQAIINSFNQSKVQNQIIGPKATLNNKALANSYSQAIELSAAGATAEDIFQATGWEKGQEGKWRKRLDTDGIKINKNNVTKANITLKQVLDYPALYELYPTLGNIKINTLPYEDKANGKVSITGMGKMFISINQRVIDSQDPEDLQKVIIHEVQHVVQSFENFMYNPAKDNEYKDYYNSFSEVEARNAATSSLVADEHKQGLKLEVTEDVVRTEQRMSVPFSQKFTGDVVFNKEVSTKDVKVKKAPGDKGEFDGVYQVLYGGKVIGEMYYDRSLYNAWYDANNNETTGNFDYKGVLGNNKEEAISEVVHRYNKANNLLNQDAQGAYDTINRVIYAVTNPNVSTPLHELAHAWEPQLTAADRKTITDWAGHDAWTTETSEQFARGFEQYLFEGKGATKEVNSIFDKFAEWLKAIYDKIVNGLKQPLNKPMEAIYEKMLGVKEVAAVTKKNILPTQEEILNQPSTETEPNYGHISQIQAALNNGYYDKQLTDKKLDEASLRQILESNGLQATLADAVVFRVANQQLTNRIQQALPTTKYDKAYIAEVSKAFKEGTLDEAARKGVVKWDKYYQMLTYIGEKTPNTNEAKVTEFVRKFYATQQVEEVEEPVEEVTIPEVTEEVISKGETILEEEPIIEPTAIEEVVNEETILQNDKIVYEGATYKDIKGKVLQVVDTHETNANVTEGFVTVKGHAYELPLFTLRKAVAEELQPSIEQQSSEAPILNADGSQVQQTNEKFGTDDIITFDNEQYKVNYSEPGVALDAKGNEINTTIYNISQVKGPKTINVPESTITAVKPSAVKRVTNNHIITLISNRFKQVFPQIETEIDAFEFDAPARFYKGRVQLNTNYQGIGVFKEGIAHEYMHPFVAALKISNKYLYNNLVKELKFTEKDILVEIDAKIAQGLYTAEDRIDEALVTFLGREISIAFDELGVPRDYSEGKDTQGDRTPSFIETQRRSLIQQFYKWWSDLMDFILGKKKVRSVDDFVQAVNNNEQQQKEAITKFINESTDEGLKYQYKKHYKSERIVLQTEIGDSGNIKLKKDENGKSLPLLVDGNTITFKQLYEKENPNQQKGNFVFHSRKNEDYGVEFTKENNTVNVFLDTDMFQDMTSIEVIRQYANRMSEFFTDNDEFDKYEEEFNTLLDSNRFTEDVAAKDAIRQKANVGALSPNMGLRGVVTLIQANLGKEAITPIEYTTDQLDVIKQMENYLKLDAEDAKKLADKRAAIVKKIKALADIATRRIGEGTKFTKLKTDSDYLSKHNTFTESDAEFIADYIKFGADSLNTAYRVFNQIKDEIADKTNLDTPKLNRLNKEIEQIKQLIAMYSDVRVLYSTYTETFDEDELSNFNKATARLEIIKAQMQYTLAELATEQIMPTIERNNKSLKAQGYNKYILSRDDVKKLLINGSSKDIGWFAYMLGAPVNSTDTINAAVSNSIADALNYVYSNNLESINELVDAYKNFTVKGLKEQEAYYKQNYLRKVKFWDIVSREDNGKPIYGYIEKYAFHQDKLYDVYEEDLRIFKSKLPLAKNFKDDEKNQDAINAWEANNKDSQKYVNQQFNKLKSDKYYQSLYGNYTKYNNKYGENRLAYGIMPQFFHESLMDKFKEKIKGFKDIAGKDLTAKERLTKLGNEVFGEQNGTADKRGLNLDGTIYRSVNSETTVFKDDAKLNYDLHSVMIDFISDAGNYEAKREVQFNIENVKQLLSGNTFFGIQERKIGTQDFATEFRQQRVAKEKLKKLDQELKNGATLYTTTFAKEVQTKYTNKGKTATNTDIDNEYEQLKLQAQGNAFKNVYDKFLGKLIPSRTNRANAQITEFINDVFYGEDEYASHVKIGGRTFDLNKTGGTLGFTQAVVNMSGNIVAGINNVLAGNMQMFIEAHGGKYFNKKDLAKAHAQYTTSLMKGDFIGDMKNPIKSEITQYGLLFDAIQGEFTNNLGEKISGNLTKRYLNASSLFLLTHAGEHQIQLTGMLALMNGYKVQTTSGKEISLKEAYEKDINGRFKLRSDVKFDKDQKQDFVRKLHGISRSLNGNYNSLHKGHLQRYWFGKLMLQYRKYLYPAIVARYGQERVDLEKGSVEVGYLRYFVSDYLFKNMIQRNFNVIKNYKNLTADQKYWVRKAGFELSTYVLLTFIALGLGSGDPEKIKNMSQAEKAILLYVIRVHNEIGMYHVDAGSEFLKQTKNPIASMRFISSIAKIGTQMFHPTDVYEQNGNGYKAGDNKLGHTFKKALPKIISYPFVDNFSIDWDNYLSYQSLIQQMPRN